MVKDRRTYETNDRAQIANLEPHGMTKFPPHTVYSAYVFKLAQKFSVTSSAYAR